MGPYAKFIVALVGALLVAVAGVLPVSGHLTQVAVVNVVIVALGALKVFLAPNAGGPGWLSGGSTKTLLAVLTAALVLLNTFLAASGSLAAITPVEWLQVIFAAAAALGVGAFRNAAALPIGRANPAP
jgi:hypothetical protein